MSAFPLWFEIPLGIFGWLIGCAIIAFALGPFREK